MRSLAGSYFVLIFFTGIVAEEKSPGELTIAVNL